MTQIIAFNGAKRHGKGVSAQFAADLIDERAFATSTQVGFADKLKLAAARALGFHDLDTAQAVALMDEAKERWDFAITKHGSDPSLDNEWSHMRLSPHWSVIEPVTTLSGRQYLQWFGTEVGRDLFGDTFWIDQVLPQHGDDVRWARAELSRRYGTDYVLITDCRFVNEAQRVKDLGGKVVEVVRPQLIKPCPPEHASEQPLPRGLVDATLINDGDLGTLRMRVEQLLGVWEMID
jgi:hypothetical protein